MLIGFEFVGVNAEKLIPSPQFSISVSQCGDTCLECDFPVFRREGLLTQRDIEAEWPYGQYFQQRFLSVDLKRNEEGQRNDT